MKRLLKFIALIIYVLLMMACCYYAIRSVLYIDEYTQETTKN